MTSRTAFVRAGAQCLVALLVGCTAAPDIVATKSSAATKDASSDFLDIPLVDGCKPGHYIGSVVSFSGDGGVDFPFAGSIQFSLVQTPSGEFLKLDPNAKLSGSTNTGASFTADIGPGGADAGDVSSGECQAGEVATNMTHGAYHVTSVDAANVQCVANECFAFDGTIKGSYQANPEAFVGTWEAHIIGTPITVQGGWSALWFDR